MHMQYPASELVIDPVLIRKYDVSGPRYTSYPTADRFSDAFGPADANAALTRLSLTSPATTGPISVYVHVPFCESLCYYCACNKVITRHHERAGEYLDLLDSEVRMVAERLGRHRRVSQLHLGGGSPTFLSDEELARLVGSLDRVFERSADIEMSIEVDPRTVTPQRLAALRALGFNRLSFGVQDFDPAVQAAGLRIEGLNYKDKPALALAFLSALGNPYVHVGTDERGAAAIDWGVYGVPETFLVAGDGRIVWKQTGPLTERAIREGLLPALAGAR